MIFVAFLALLYFLPTVVASSRGHGTALILLLNLFLGWTVIGWFVLLIWALVSCPCYRVMPVPVAYYYPPNPWRR